MKELNAFKQLYKELTDRYNKLGYQDEYFEIDYTDERCWLQRCLRNKEREDTTSPIRHDLIPELVSIGLDYLVQMERNLLKLERGLK